MFKPFITKNKLIVTEKKRAHFSLVIKKTDTDVTKNQHKPLRRKNAMLILFGCLILTCFGHLVSLMLQITCTIKL